MIGDRREYVEVFFEENEIGSVRCTTRVWFHDPSGHILIEQKSVHFFGDLTGKFVVDPTRTVQDCMTGGDAARIGIDVHDQLCTHTAKVKAA